MPAVIRRSKFSGEEVAGPIVATIFTWRIKSLWGKVGKKENEYDGDGQIYSDR
jgi:hypothetical protein